MALIEVMRWRLPCFLLPLTKSQPYQGIRVKTPVRISSAANSAATTAQLSTDNNQVFREFSATALVLMVLSLFRPSAHGCVPRMIFGRLAAPKLLADFLDLLRRDASYDHQRRCGKFCLVCQARHAGPPNLLLRACGVGNDHARQIVR